MPNCSNCKDPTVRNATPATATATAAAIPTDANCPNCGMAVTHTGITDAAGAPRWPDVVPAGSPATPFPIDPATGAPQLTAGMARAPWIVPPPAPPAPAGGVGQWFKDNWRPLTGVAVAIVACLGIWWYASSDEDPIVPPAPIVAGQNNPPAPTVNPNTGAVNNPPVVANAGSTNTGPTTIGQGSTGAQGGNTNQGGSTGSAPNNGQGNPQAPTVAQQAPAVPPPAPTCSVTTHPRPMLFDLAATGSNAIRVGTNGAPEDCELPPAGMVTPVVVGNQLLSWYCCTPGQQVAAANP